MAKKKKKIRRKLKQKRRKKTSNPQSSIVNRRSHPRLPICARVIWGKKEKKEQYFFTSNISGAGLYLISDHPPPLHEELDLEISIPSIRQTFKLKGKVMRWEGKGGRAVGCGVKFQQVNPQLSHMIQEILKKVDFCSA